MAVDRVQFQDVVASQLPRFVREDFPLLPDFLEQYYSSQEYQGGSFDLLQNIDQYVKVDQLCNLTNSTILHTALDYNERTVQTSSPGQTGITTTVAANNTVEVNETLYVVNDGNYTDGFPETNGLIKINDEIIKYETKDSEKFYNCTRGFSGITSYISPNTNDELVFDVTVPNEHPAGSVIYNLNIIFLQEFFKNLKSQVAPGFTDRTLYTGLDKKNFIFNSNSFYNSKGTDSSFKILFNSLYGKDVDIIRPSELLLRPSDADYKVTKDFVVETVSGDPGKLKNLTLFQRATGAKGAVSNIRKIDSIPATGAGSTTVAYKQEVVPGTYYQISLDDHKYNDATSSTKDFKPNPKTKLLTKVSLGSTIIDVDSTVGFPTTGFLAVRDVNNDLISIAYTGKSINQFFNISGITSLTELSAKEDISLDSYSYAYVGINTSEEIRVRVNATLKDFELDKEAYYYNSGDTINIKSLGVESSVEPSRHWTFNTQTEWNVLSIEEVDLSENVYKVNVFDNQFLDKGYQVNISINDVIKGKGRVVGINSLRSFDVKLETNIDTSADGYIVENQLLKGKSNLYTKVNSYVANVQNSYATFDGDVLVASNSLPHYNNLPTDPYNKTAYFNGTPGGSSSETITLTHYSERGSASPSLDHGFFTGDAVYYEAEGEWTVPFGSVDPVRSIKSQLNTSIGKLTESVYYIYRVNSTQVKLARSRADIFAAKFILLSGDVTDSKFTYYDYYQKTFEPQSIYRHVTSPSKKGGNFVTEPGYTAILNNGVELLNYKSSDVIYYGDLKSAEVTKGGINYDVINPPNFHLFDSVGSGATGITAVKGQLERIDILDQGFDYVGTPTIEIKGGNGSGAVAEANMSLVIHEPAFNAEGTIGVGATNPDIILGKETIGFGTYHKFKNAESVIYDSQGETGVGGLSTFSTYYVEVVDNYTIKLHTSVANARVGIDTVNLTSYGTGTQRFRSSERKRIVSGIVVKSSGSGYQNKQKTIPTSGINTATNVISITNHGYESGEIVQYTSGGSAVGGLSESSNYYVRKVDDNSFSLSLVGGTNQEKYYYDNNVVVNLTTTGDGSFNYEPITVSVKGTVGIATTVGTAQDFNCKVQPIFRGEIDSVDITTGGVGYGASEILNFNRQPDITFKSGENAQLEPIISNGKIVSINIRSGGSSYNSPPDLTIKGPTGKYARLTPQIENGVIVDVKIISGGVGFTTDKTTIEVKAAGENAIVEVTPKEWNINNFEKYYNAGASAGLIKEDDGFLTRNIGNTSLEYGALYAPRALRKASYMVSANWDELIFPKVHYGVPDLNIQSGREVFSGSQYHSPILGWAYDGHPIYGTYGYKGIEGGVVEQMTSGYSLVSAGSTFAQERPPLSTFPNGFFVEDYLYTGNGTLDEHNGRFCVTPEYPNGTYAYFITLSENNESSGPFDGVKRPTFPYVIGNSFASQPNDFNFKSISNQTDYDIEGKGWFRNTANYNIGDAKSGYKFIFNSNEIQKQSLDITASSVGNVQSVGIFTGGTDYRYKDTVDFNNEGTSGTDAGARVERLAGKEISVVSSSTTSFEFVEYASGRSVNEFIGFTSSPHNFLNNQIFNISGFSSYFDGFDGNYKVGVRSDSFALNSGIGSVGTTGIVTYFGVSGILEYPSLRTNDILGIGTEKLKVLNIDKKQQRIRVLREQEGTVGSGWSATAYVTGTPLFEDPKKFTVNVGTVKTTKTLRINSEHYFYPAESVGVGTTNSYNGVGLGNTLVFSNPGTGATNIFVKPQHVYIPDHGLKLNDKLYYFPNGGGTAPLVWNGKTPVGTGTTSLNLLADYFYAAPLGKDFIGISSNKVGIGTTNVEGTANPTGAPGYVGVGTTAGLLYFIDSGLGSYHSFKTSLEDVVTSQVDRTLVTVSTASTHGLAAKDKVWVSVLPTTAVSVDVRYNDHNRRMIFNPVSFTASDVDTQYNTITFTGHDFRKGEKVIHTAATSSGGLSDESMYYVVPYSKDKVRLVSDKFQVTDANPAFINITSASAGTLSKINPLLEVNNNNVVTFDLSDSSLSFFSSGDQYSAFSLGLYRDNEFSTPFYTTAKPWISGTPVGFAVTFSGEVGFVGAALTVQVSNETPVNLWYKFDVDTVDKITAIKKQLIIDKDQDSWNQINLVKTAYDGEYEISGVGSTTFQYTVNQIPDTSSFNSDTSKSTYETNSATAYGSIAQIKMLDGGFGYKSLPGITSVVSGLGTGAILFAESKNIGQIIDQRFNANGIGWDYPTDETLRPIANLPEILKIQSLMRFESIGISSVGIGYFTAPDLVVIDGYSKKQVTDVDLEYTLGDENVTILKNSTSMYNSRPTILPVNNSNGVGISSVEWDSANLVVKLYLDATFSEAADFHYAVGETVLVENISSGVGSTGLGYNSENYNWTLFPLTAVDGKIGGSGAYVSYSLDGYVSVGSTPGVVDLANSYGRVVPSKDFPIFDPVLKTTDFLIGEDVVTNNETPYLIRSQLYGAAGPGKGVVESWNPNTNRLKASIDRDLSIGDKIRGVLSNTQGIVESKIDFNADIKTGAGATVIGGWQRTTGFLNNDQQRLPNNEYYQNFSYSLKSEVSKDVWDDPVSILNHTAGFDKYSDLQIISVPTNSAEVGIGTTNSVEIVTDIVGKGSLQCFYDFDYVTEGVIEINKAFLSNEISFENKILTDYYQSIGNRVLSIDDFSGTFNSNEGSSQSSSFASFNSNDIFNKSVVLVKDITYTDERQFGIVSVLQHNGIGYVNQYGGQCTVDVTGPHSDVVYDELGTFDYLKTGTGWDLTFNPIKFEYNEYELSALTISVVNDSTTTGIQTLGDVSQVSNVTVDIGAGTTTTIATISTAWRAHSFIINLEDTSQNFHGSQLNLIHDGTSVYASEYGSLTNSTGAMSTGFGTFSASISGSNVVLQFIPSVSVALTCKYSLVSVANTASTSTGSTVLSCGRVSSAYTSISSSGSPSAVGITSYTAVGTAATSGGYYLLSIEDTTNNNYSLAEVCVLNSALTESWIEFGNVDTGAGIGTVGIQSTGNYIELMYTPIASADVQVRMFKMEARPFNGNSDSTEIDLNLSDITSKNGYYNGTKVSVKSDFPLQHQALDIFRRVFDGSNAAVANTATNLVEMGDHFFVTGEKVKYSYLNSDSDAAGSTTNAISIASTNVSGIGVTDKLPTTLYCVKVGAGSLRFTDTATKALQKTPNTFEISSVGIGTSHVIASINPNGRALMAIDNMIQAPISGTAITTGLSTGIVYQQKIPVTGFTSIFSSDIVQVDDELMKVIHVGYAGSSQITVLRGQLGTTMGVHTVGAAVTKMSGNYNIVDNRVYFASAPYGQVPLSTTTGDPDSRDWAGITTHSSFQGRVFMRRAETDTTDPAYASNYIFDDLSNQFTGITSDFILKSDKQNVTGFSTFNGIVLINNIFQQPLGVQAEASAYTMEEDVGITTINFNVGTGNTIAEGYDPNKSSYPMGGVIISVGSSEGFGYQPLISAGGTAQVSTAGTISSVSIGNTGAGYRKGVQVPNVGIQTYSSGIATITNIGTATVQDGRVVSVNITNPKVFYKPRDIQNVGYSSISGLTTVSTLLPHGLTNGDRVLLSGIAWTCSYSPPLSISTVGYTSTTGIMTVTTSGTHGLAVGKEVILTGLGMTCDIDSGVGLHFYPRGKDFAYDNAVGIASTTSTTIVLDVGHAGKADQYTHTFVSAATSAIISGGDYTHQFVDALSGAVISGGDYNHQFVSAGVGSISVGGWGASGVGTTTATYATYDGSTGHLVLTVAGHGLDVGTEVGIDTGSIGFTCEMDDYGSTKYYPRATDPISGYGTTTIIGTTENTFTVNVGLSTIVNYDVTNATYDGSTGLLVLTIGAHNFFMTKDSVKLKNDSLNFRCSMDNYNSLHSYPRSTDPYYNTAVGIASTSSTTITLNVGISTLVYYTPTGADYNPVVGIMTVTIGSHNLFTGRNIKIAESGLTFTCSKDSNATQHSYPRKPDPYYGGVAISSIPATNQLVVNVGVSTVGTYYSTGGTVQGAIIAPRATDPASQGTEVLRIIDNKTFEVNTGTTTCDHFYARGGLLGKPTKVVIDEPLSYENIPLVYSSDSATGVGQSATVDIVVGQGSSVISFSLDQTGVGYGVSEILTVPVGGETGIPTNTSLTFQEFQLNIDEIHDDNFNGWSVGELEVLDRIDSKFDGYTKAFGITLSENPVSIQAAKGSQIDVQMVLLVFINDILQEPGAAYIFNGGSTITFTTAPKAGDSSKILFYKGSGSIDVVFTDVLETVKVGDTLDIDNVPEQGQNWSLNEDPRTVTGINTMDSVNTNIYPGPGVTTDGTLKRTVDWCKQEYDITINGADVGKDRIHYEPAIYPAAYMISSAGVGTTAIYVNTLRPLFNANDEATIRTFQDSIVIESQDVITAAAATATVSVAGTVSAITVGTAGAGYTVAPNVTIGNASGVGTNSPVGVATTTRATATATLSAGTVSAITVSYGGTTTGVAYTTSSPPPVLIDPPKITRETLDVITTTGYKGDYGSVVGFGTTVSGGGQNRLYFDLWIPLNSYMRDTEYVGSAVTISGISTGDFLTVFNSNVNSGLSTFATQNTSGTGVGIGTSCVDGVYQVFSAETRELPSTVLGFTTHLRRIFCNVDNVGTGIAYTTQYNNNDKYLADLGEFSWGKILINGVTQKAFNFYGDNGVTGISTSALVTRAKSLKYKDYT